MRILLALAAAAFTAACANMGRPDGGPRDTTPPVYVRSNPSPGQLHFKGNKIHVDFDENIALDDAMNRVIVSPAQRTTPAITANGRRITVELRDTLLPSTTYTIDFADAVKDLNEGNLLDGLALDFSTGDSIDTLRISGMVFEAATLEPAQGMLVGAYTAAAMADTTLTSVPLERITKTNQLGQFTLRNLKAGSYRIFAVNDVNRDYHWDRSEDIAFYPSPVTPGAERVEVTDTLAAQDGSDSLVTRTVTRFTPDDLLLTWFNEGYSAQYLRDYKRPERNKITLQFGARADSLPILRLLNTHRAGQDISQWSALDASATLDTLTYWITDTTLSALDSITLEARYLRTDTLDELSWTTDTLKLNMRPVKKKEEKKKKKKDDAETPDSIPPEIPHINLNVSSGTSQELNRGLTLTSSTPIEWMDPAGAHLEMQVDTVWYTLPAPVFARREPLRPMVYDAPYEWEEGLRYRLVVDSGSVRDIYGLVNNPISHEFTTKKADDYSTVTFNITGLEGKPAVVEVLQNGDKVSGRAPVSPSGTVTVEYLQPGTYYARLFIDNDSNGMWSKGSVADSIQPEDVYYYPKKLALKKNWTVEQSWDINELPLDQQKPQEIKKNKPRRRGGRDDEGDGRRDDGEEEQDEFFDDPFMNDATRNGNFINNTGFNRADYRQY